MQLTVVGSGTVVPTGRYVCACLYVDAGDARILLDCGPGAVHHMARFGVPWPTLTHVAVTHFHNDHIGDVPMLLFALKHALREKRDAPLVVYGPQGIRERIDRMADAFGDHVRDPGFPVDVHEVEGNERMGGVTLQRHKTPHTDESLAYRLDADSGASLGYTGDTGPSIELGDFFRDVDVLVAECSLPDDEAMPMHLTPSSVAALAARARPRTLLLTHIYPHLDRTRLGALIANAGYNGRTQIARDGLPLPLTPSPA